MSCSRVVSLSPAESVVDPPLAGVRVNRVPDRLARLVLLRQQVPVNANPLVGGAGREMQRYVVLAVPARPDDARRLPPPCM
jgi:hypothetical protein